MNKPVNTLEYAKMLEQSGMERAHAEAVANLQAQVIGELVERELVTKDDLKAALHGLEPKFDGLELKLKDEIRAESGKLREEMRSLALAQDRRTDTMMLQIRSLQMSSAIAAFAIASIVMLSRLIR